MTVIMEKNDEVTQATLNTHIQTYKQQVENRQQTNSQVVFITKLVNVCNFVYLFLADICV